MTSRAQWQHRLDQDFPNGIIMTWHGRPYSPVYHIPRAEVTHLAGTWDWPVVSLDTHGTQKNFVIQIAVYDKLHDHPALVRVTAMNISEQMTWDANVAPELAEAMRAGTDR